MAGQSVNDSANMSGKPGSGQGRHRNGRSRSPRRESREPARQRSASRSTSAITPASSPPPQTSSSDPHVPRLLSPRSPPSQLSSQPALQSDFNQLGGFDEYTTSDESRDPGHQINTFYPIEVTSGTVSLDSQGVEAFRSVIESMKAHTGASEAVVQIIPVYTDPETSDPDTSDSERDEESGRATDVAGNANGDTGSAKTCKTHDEAKNMSNDKDKA